MFKRLIALVDLGCQVVLDAAMAVYVEFHHQGSLLSHHQLHTVGQRASFVEHVEVAESKAQTHYIVRFDGFVISLTRVIGLDLYTAGAHLTIDRESDIIDCSFHCHSLTQDAQLFD